MSTGFPLLSALLLLGCFCVLQVDSQTFTPDPSWVSGAKTQIRTIDGVRALCIAFSKGQYHTTQRGEKKLTLKAANTHTVSYQVYFEKGYDFNKGGKLPGLIGGKGTTGCRPAVADGWSARFMWVREGKMILYLYSQNRENRCGNGVQTGVTFETNKWYNITETVTVNSPGASNGAITVQVNGRTVLNDRDLKLRGNVGSNVALVDRLYFSTFYGGGSSDWSPRSDSTVCYSNFVVK
eukprot:TRINITY_DN5850_c0_g1_i2.p1 TRINITY_DN5850_c0_g1~~TRINITY_DN5850_c0_g1_i2.p1  ORF type:complete len:237 (-),score=63.08 TRINITY_DN5850_c0_g1_i2:39-749(-)